MSGSRAAAVAALAFVLIIPDRAAAQGPRDYPIAPVPFTAVRLTDAFWAPRIETNRTVTIPAIFRKCEETGRIDNFAIAGGLIKGEYKGERYNDTDVYKTIEGASYSLMVHPDPELDRDPRRRHRQDRRGPGAGRLSLHAADGKPRERSSRGRAPSDGPSWP